MNLDVDKWGTFRVADLFPVLQNGKANQGMLSDGNECFYVGAKKDDNGVMIHCAYDEELVQKGNCIIFICNGQGSVGFANYMDVDFIGTTDIVAGYNENLNQYNGLFIATILCQERPKYSFGRKWKTHLRDTVIKLPKTESDTPDWQYMESYVKTLHHTPLTTKNKFNTPLELKTDEWKEFALNRIFTLRGGFYNKKPEHTIAGNIPFLASTESNNGVTEYYSIDDIYQWDKVGGEDYTLDKKIYKGNCITVTVNGSVCNAFYQTDDFTCSHDITALYIKGHEMDPYLAHFLCAVIMQDKYRWSYGRKPHDVKKFGKSIISLPVLRDPAGDPFVDKSRIYSDDGYVPDWNFMATYIKFLPYGDRI